MNALPPVTVVVPVCNHAATLRAVFDALDATDWPDLEVVAVDCGSKDGSLERLQQRAARTGGVPFRLLERPGIGRASAFNEGFAAAGRRDVVRLHADVVPDEPSWLRQLHAVLQQHPDCGVLGCKIVLAGGRIQTCGRDLVRGLGIVPEGSDRRWLEGDTDDASRPTEVDGVSGELCWIRRATLDATGGLDPGYDPVFGDDDDFCLLARWHGFRVLVEPAVRAVHYAPRRSTTTNLHPHEPSGLLVQSLDLRRQLQEAHADYFRQKWGFDPRCPDLHEVRRRYGHTRICWRIGERLTETLPERPAVDVCLVTWNSMAVLPRMLDHLAATRWPQLHVWITDNGSTDGTVEWLAQRAATFPFPLQVQRLPTNVGVAPALNIALQRGDAPLVARLDDDTVVPPEWLERLVPRFHQRPYAGMVGPKVLHDNEGQALQNGPQRLWPGSFAGLGADSSPLVDGLVRVISIRGCCNVYRRSVFREAGWLDVRYAPSQFDEWDHHLALCNAGYEVLYDGSIAVRHLLTAGRMATPSALANFTSNLQKTQGKWGAEHLRTFDLGIDLSIDGRCLPPDGDTRLLRQRLPAVPDGPPRPLARDPVVVRELFAFARRRSLLRSPIGPLGPSWQSQIELGEIGLADGQPLTMALVMKFMDLLPHDAHALMLVARYRRLDGDGPGSRRTAAWALRLDPDNEQLQAHARALATPITPAMPLPRRATRTPPPVLLLPPMEASEDIAHHAVDVTAAALQAAGVPFRIAREFVPELHGETVVHAFGLGEASTMLPRLQVVRAQSATCRILLSPLVSDPGRANWYGRIVGSRFHADDGELRHWIAAAAAGRLQTDGAVGRHLADDGGSATAHAAACLRFADGLVLQHPAEREWLERTHGPLPPIHDVADGLLPFDDVDTGLAEHVPVRGVLAIGPRDLPDNHLPLVLAAQGLDLPVALCGRPGHPFGEARTRQRGGDWLHWLPTLRGPAIPAALAKSAVLVWLPGTPVSFALPLQAAALGCELVLAHDVGAQALFGTHAHYVDPLDLPALRQALQAAHGAWRPENIDDDWRQALRDAHGASAYGRRLLAVYGLTGRLAAAAPTLQPA